nr:MAG TPA: protein of unknown function DUF4512 [Caudoviricetes sp.]
MSGFPSPSVIIIPHLLWFVKRFLKYFFHLTN